MECDPIRLLLLLLFTGLLVSVAAPAAAVPHRRGYRRKSRSSTGDDVTTGPSLPLPLGEGEPDGRSGSAVLVLADPDVNTAQLEEIPQLYRG